MMQNLSEELKKVVTDSIAYIINEHPKHFITFAEASSGYSFETWLNTELCVTLERNTDVYKVINEDSSAYPENYNRADLTFKLNNQRAVVELKIAHPRTQDKYMFSCMEDMEKLKLAKLDDVKFFVLVVVSCLTKTKFKQDKDGWQQWIDAIFKEEPINLETDEINYDLIDKKGSVHVYIKEILSLKKDNLFK